MFSDKISKKLDFIISSNRIFKVICQGKINYINIQIKGAHISKDKTKVKKDKRQQHNVLAAA